MTQQMKIANRDFPFTGVVPSNDTTNADTYMEDRINAIAGLAGRPAHRSPARQPFRRSPIEDRRLIDSARAEAGGRVSGPLGAAAILGIPPSTGGVKDQIDEH